MPINIKLSIKRPKTKVKNVAGIFHRDNLTSEEIRLSVIPIPNNFSYRILDLLA